MPQDDAPPEKAVEVLAMAAGMLWKTSMGLSDAWLSMRDALSDADRQALAEWIAPAGMVLVPREPTVDMLVAGTEQWLVVAAMEDRAAVIWHAMLAAAKEASDG